MIVTRRSLLLPLVATPALFSQKIDDNQEVITHVRWQRFLKTHNDFAARLNEGVFDVKLWGKFKGAMRDVGGCER